MRVTLTQSPNVDSESHEKLRVRSSEMGRPSGKKTRKTGKTRKDARSRLGEVDPAKRKALEAILKKRQEKGDKKKQNGHAAPNPPAKGSSRGAGASTSRRNLAGELFAKAEECLEVFKFDEAKAYCERALQAEPRHTRALELLGDLLAEEGEIERARQCFTKAIEVEPEEGYVKYMYLGQLSEGLEAVQHYEKGVHIMEKTREGQKGASAAAAVAEEGTCVTNAEISRAYSSIAEIYLTDACFEENAEQRCKECLDRSLEEDPRNAEAHQLMASYWLSKENKEKCKECLDRSLEEAYQLMASYWLSKENKENAKVSMETSLSLWVRDETGEEEDGDDDDEHQTLSYQSRIEAAKILIELEELDKSESVLCGLLDESDTVAQVWYMLGLIQVERNTDYYQPFARFYLNRAKKVFLATECDDTPILEHVTEMLEQLGPGEGDQADWLEQHTIQEEGLEEIGEGDEEEGSSSSEEEDEMKE